VAQRYTSADTSVNTTKPPAIARLVERLGTWRPGTINVDLGCGSNPTPFTLFLEDRGVFNVPIDPYNQTEEEGMALRGLLACIAPTTVTISNVLNVVKEKKYRRQILLQAKGHLREGGTVYITVYEGNKSGKGGESKRDCWQENRETEDYLKEVRRVFPGATRSGKLIVAPCPSQSLSSLNRAVTCDQCERTS
jgi:hypothetical protein